MRTAAVHGDIKYRVSVNAGGAEIRPFLRERHGTRMIYRRLYNNNRLVAKLLASTAARFNISKYRLSLCGCVFFGEGGRREFSIRGREIRKGIRDAKETGPEFRFPEKRTLLSRYVG